MNSLKTLFVAAVLIAVLYGAYLALNRGPEPAPPPEVAAAWPGDMNIEQGTEMQPPTVLFGTRANSTGPAMASTATATTVPTTTVPAPKMSMNFADPRGGSPKPPFMKSDPKPPAPPINAPLQHNFPNTNPAVASKSAPAAWSTAPPVAQPAVGPTAGIPSQQSFASLMSTVRAELDRKNLLSAYRMLSSRYHDPKFTPNENRQLEQLLDQLAGTIVYSTQHFIEKPHRVAPNETLEQIARQYSVPPQLLAKINSLTPSQRLNPGSELKVIRGPFSAEINLSKHELTLTLPDGGYAGRFPIAVGRDVPKIDKPYRVFDKIETPSSTPSAPGVNAAAPVAKQKWIGLEKRLGIHTTANPQDIGRSDVQGGISLRKRDINDLYDILSVGSQVVIRR